MALGFPLYIDLSGNNCVVFGGGDFAYRRTIALLRFGAKVTVISPILEEPMRTLDQAEKIRYIPRKYYRGDCTSAYLCVAATEDEALNITISDECKAKGIPINVSKPAAFGTFIFPTIALTDKISVSVAGKVEEFVLENIRDAIEAQLPKLLEEAEKISKL